MDRPRTGGGTTALRTAMCRTSWVLPPPPCEDQVSELGLSPCADAPPATAAESRLTESSLFSATSTRLAAGLGLIRRDGSRRITRRGDRRVSRRHGVLEGVSG